MTMAFESINYTYPGSGTGVHDLSMTVGPGELVALIGASGSGKTTALKLLAGFTRPQAGLIRIGDRDVTEVTAEERRLGVVFQNYALFPHLCAWENVAFPLRVRGVPHPIRRAQAIQMLERVGMGARVGSMPHMLSGGQQQRVALARALVFDPKGLLLDEPLSALDAALRVEMRDEILRVQRQSGIATLLVTHDQEEALSVADRVAVMREGRIVQIGTPRVLYDTPVDAYVAGFVGQSNLWPGIVEREGLVGTSVGPIACVTGTRTRGDAVIVFVRPEWIEPLARSPRAEVAGEIAGETLSDRFLGPVRRIDLAVGTGMVRLETHLRTPVSAVRIPPERVRLLPPLE
ncbi:ABC transporter ATP-binding protein [Rhizobium herbae]|uniref:Spermidine/putrescine transport system ATP-binding protein n=1 Tax=Rhizobium herbae TaxID=508661 RepID=A0ABS4EG06_9HYPH|nr:ABC transporter ATP-binding protein [Rhizobium herbae]MBP1856875.1 putative spermidine/putrescine transport system ATP-binding protein [Rhizobium herbae]